MDDDILLSSSNGKCLRFPVEKLRLFSGLNSSGVRGIKLDKGNTITVSYTHLTLPTNREV